MNSGMRDETLKISSRDVVKRNIHNNKFRAESLVNKCLWEPNMVKEKIKSLVALHFVVTIIVSNLIHVSLTLVSRICLIHGSRSIYIFHVDAVVTKNLKNL